MVICDPVTCVFFSDCHGGVASWLQIQKTRAGFRKQALVYNQKLFLKYSIVIPLLTNDDVVYFYYIGR